MSDGNNRERKYLVAYALTYYILHIHIYIYIDVFAAS